MAKRTSIPRWDDLNTGGVNSWANQFLPGQPSSPEEWKDALISDVMPSADDAFDVLDQGGPTMMTTSSTNPTKPRTLQAGYDIATKKLVVIFRDGTWWEYREVPINMWIEFKSAESKGKYLRSSGLDSWSDMGPADVTNMPRHRRAQMNDVQKFADYMYRD